MTDYYQIPAVPDFSDVYTSGTLIFLNPVESNAIFLTVAGLCSSIEFLFQISADVDSEYYQQLFEVITEETLVFGVVQLFMVLIASLTKFREAWDVMLSWAQLLMIYMAGWLTIFVLLVATHNAGQRKFWHTYETVRMKSSASQHDEREKLFGRCIKKLRMTMFSYEYDMRKHSITFCDYLAVFEKKYVVQLLDLSWKSWLSMVITAVANALRAGWTVDLLTAQEDYQKFVPAVLFVILNGFFPLFFFYGITNTLNRRLNQYLDLGAEKYEARLEIIEANLLEPDASKHEEVQQFMSSDLQDPKSFLIWQSLDITLTMIQVSILQIVWYYSVLIIDILGPLAKLQTWSIIVIIVFGLIPGILLWRTLSWTITIIAILSSLEISADRELIDKLCGITKEDRKREDEAKENEEKAAKEAERKKKLEAMNVEDTGESELDGEGRMKVLKGKKRPVEFDDFSMSRIALDRKEMLRRYDEREGFNNL